MFVLSSTKSPVVILCGSAPLRTQSTSPPTMVRNPPRLVLTTLHHWTFVFGMGKSAGEGEEAVQYDSNE